MLVENISLHIQIQDESLEDGSRDTQLEAENDFSHFSRSGNTLGKSTNCLLFNKTALIKDRNKFPFSD